MAQKKKAPAKKAADKGPSKKTVMKEKTKLVQDKTFGLKNKQKSKKVQKHIKGVEQKLKATTKKDLMELNEREKLKLKKLAEKARERELKTIFNAAGGGSSSNDKQNENEENEYNEKDIMEEVEEDMRNEEEMTLEEVIDKERAKIIDGTMVTWESFTKWKEFKLEQQSKTTERLKKLQEEAFKKGGSGISGRFLFEMDKSLFVDDEEAADEYVRDEDVDEDLFLDGDDEEPEAETSIVYDPETYKLKDPPKGLLHVYCQKNKYALPEYENMSQGNGYMLKVTLPHLKKTFETNELYSNKKRSENNAALKAYVYIMKEEGTEFKYQL